ncbi:putative protein C7orf31 like [Crotalus adamanteus]|uniref:Uncharacterized protein n=1 Tax=Crotalus adamanteus TaxID=8729 RepID=A0AAW1B4G5_CROAD
MSKQGRAHNKEFSILEGRFRPFHPYVHSSTDIQVGPNKKADANQSIHREAVACSNHVTEGIGHQDETPKSTFQLPESDLSPRAANILENVKKALWLSTYKRDYTGSGPMKPLQLDDYNAKLIGRATGELGKNVDLTSREFGCRGTGYKVLRTKCPWVETVRLRKEDRLECGTADFLHAILDLACIYNGRC